MRQHEQVIIERPSLAKKPGERYQGEKQLNYRCYHVNSTSSFDIGFVLELSSAERAARIEIAFFFFVNYLYAASWQESFPGSVRLNDTFEMYA